MRILLGILLAGILSFSCAKDNSFEEDLSINNSNGNDAIYQPLDLHFEIMPYVERNNDILYLVCDSLDMITINIDSESFELNTVSYLGNTDFPIIENIDGFDFSQDTTIYSITIPLKNLPSGNSLSIEEYLEIMKSQNTIDGPHHFSLVSFRANGQTVSKTINSTTPQVSFYIEIGKLHLKFGRFPIEITDLTNNNKV